MTVDAVALCRDQPDAAATLAAMRSAGRELRVDTAGRGAVVQLRDEAGRPVLSVEPPRLVQVPGEARRLLGLEGDLPHPAWWVEARAPGGDPHAASVARRFVTALVSLTGGVSWSSR